MSRNRHSKNRRNTDGMQRTSGVRRTRQSRASKNTGSSTSTGAIPSSMSSMTTEMSDQASQALQSARGTAMTLAGNAIQSIKSHPMQYALAGLGVACAGAGITWLLVSTAKHAYDAEGNPLDFQHRLQASMKDVRSSVKGATKSVRSAASNVNVSQLAQDAMKQTKRIEQSVEDVVREHPIAVGAALLATGAAIAMAIPRSAIEDTWLGRERDQVVTSAQKLAQGAMQKAQTIAKQMSSSAANGTANAHA